MLGDTKPCRPIELLLIDYQNATNSKDCQFFESEIQRCKYYHSRHDSLIEDTNTDARRPITIGKNTFWF
jgi:hypothetical protein